jgi:hypothetical protein
MRNPLARVTEYLAAKRGRPPKAFTHTAEPGHQKLYGTMGRWTKEMIYALENPDKVIAAEGFGIYDEMIDRDGQVKSSMHYKISISLARDHQIKDAGDTPQDKKWGNFIRDNIEMLPRELKRYLWDLEYGAWVRGCADLEIGYQIIDSGEWAGMIGWSGFREIYPDPDTWEFIPDRFGQLKGVGSIKQNQDGKWVPLDPEKFIIYPNNFRCHNWHGESDLKAIFGPYALKDYTHRFQGVFIERYGGPIPFGKYNDGAPPGEIEQYMEVLNTAKLMNAVVVPKSWEAELWSPDNVHAQIFAETIAQCDKAISRGMNLPELVQSEGQTHGSYGLGLMQYDRPFLSHLKFKTDEAEDHFNQAIKRLILKNDPTVRRFPKLKLDPIRESPDANMLRLLELIQAGLPNTDDFAAWFLHYFGFPLPELEGTQQRIDDGNDDDIDATAEQINNSVISKLESDHAQGRLHWGQHLGRLRTELVVFAHAQAPIVPREKLDELCQAEVGAWVGQMKAQLEETPDTGFADFNIEQALFDFGRKVKEYAPRN